MKSGQIDMGKPQEAARPGIRFRAGSILTLLFLAAFAVATIGAWKWPYIAQLMPLYFVAIPGMLLCLVQLYRDLVYRGNRSDARQEGVQVDEAFRAGPDVWTEARRTLGFFGWFTAGAVGIWLLGMTIALPLLAFSYALFEGHEKWSVSLLLASGAFLFLWGLFEYTLNIRWPLGVLLSSYY